METLILEMKLDITTSFRTPHPNYSTERNFHIKLERQTLNCKAQGCYLQNQRKTLSYIADT